MTTFVVLVAATAFSAGAAAQPNSLTAQPTERAQATGLSALVEIFDERVHPDILLNAPIDTSGFQPILQELTIAQADLVASQEATVELTVRLAKQRASKVELTAQIDQAQVELGSAAEDKVEASDGLKNYALSSFRDSGAPLLLDTLTTGEVDDSLGLRRQIEADLSATESSARATHEQHQDDVDRLNRSRVELIAALDLNAETLKETERRIIELEANIETLVPTLVDEVLLAPVHGLPFPVVVLDAYYRAQLQTAQSKPQCAVSWSQLAGIGKVETIHGTYQGRVVSQDGRTSTPILGPELNGDPFLAISDSDGGLLDNNTVWDHAVGPMQFIPTSWELYGADGNGDGIKDPHNMYDATLAASNHLCGSRSQLSDSNNFTAALLGYNRSTSYGVSVKAYATAYAAAVSLN